MCILNHHHHHHQIFGPINMAGPLLCRSHGWAFNIVKLSIGNGYLNLFFHILFNFFQISSVSSSTFYSTSHIHTTTGFKAVSLFPLIFLFFCASSTSLFEIISRLQKHCQFQTERRSSMDIGVPDLTGCLLGPCHNHFWPTQIKAM